MAQKLWIPHKLPGLNQMLKSKGSGKHAYNREKRQIQQEIYWLCIEQGITWMEKAWFRFVWVEAKKNRDPDNIAAARKYILDGLVEARRLAGDRWKNILGWQDEFKVNKEAPGVEVYLYEEKPYG